MLRNKMSPLCKNKTQILKAERSDRNEGFSEILLES